jgi:hypothetical protein
MGEPLKGRIEDDICDAVPTGALRGAGGGADRVELSPDDHLHGHAHLRCVLPVQPLRTGR